MNNAMLLYAHLTDKEVLDIVIRSGQKTSFEVLVRRHSNALYRIARMYGFSHNEAEDLIQCAHLEAYTQKSSFSGSISYRTWLTKLMIKSCLHARKESLENRDEQLVEPACSAARSAQHYDSQRLPAGHSSIGKIEACLEQLPLPMRSVYILTEIDGYSISEAAFLLSTSEDSIRLRLGKAKASIRKSMRRWHQFTEIYPLDLHSIDRITTEVMGNIDKKSDHPVGVPTY